MFLSGKTPTSSDRLIRHMGKTGVALDHIQEHQSMINQCPLIPIEKCSQSYTTNCVYCHTAREFFDSFPGIEIVNRRLRETIIDTLKKNIDSSVSEEDCRKQVTDFLEAVRTAIKARYLPSTSFDNFEDKDLEFLLALSILKKHIDEDEEVINEGLRDLASDIESIMIEIVEEEA